MIRAVIFFILGIAAALRFPDAISLSVGRAAVGAAGLAYIVIFVCTKSRLQSVLTGLLGLGAVMGAGFVHALSFADTHAPHHLVHQATSGAAYTVRVIGPAEKKKRTTRYTVQVERLHDGTKWLSCTGKMWLYVTDRPPSTAFEYGDRWLVAGRPRAIAEAQNPHEFDLKRFLALKNIYHQAFVKPSQVRRIAHASPGIDPLYYAYRARVQAAHIIQKYVTDKDAQAIALALTLGVSDHVDNTLRQAYAASGAMHVLAVSGLHVGILYGILVILLAPLRAAPGGRWYIAAASLTVLWGYALVTGMSPSVLRAVTLFSFFTVGQLAGRGRAVYHALAGSAFLLLCVNPYLVASVGFQLSYLAVLGIVTLYRPMYRLWEPRSALLDKAWALVCVSLSAQLGTFAVALLYFHQLPVYFLPANLLVAPGALGILSGGLLVLGTGFMPVVATALGTMLTWLITAMNAGLFWLQGLPFSVVENVFITPFQCLLLMATVASLYFLLATKKIRYALLVAICISTYVTTRWIHFYRNTKPDRWVVYALAGHTAVDWIKEGRAHFYADSALTKDAEAIRFHILPNRLFCGARTVRTHALNSDRRVCTFYCGGKLFAVVNGPVTAFPRSLHVDYLIVENHAIPSLAAAQRMFRFERLILGKRNTLRYCERMIREGRAGKVYSIPHQGAYVETH